ncbi:MAG: hypothetical protein JWO52_1927 [Gammaproteobacteria bacterium]|nr:hypothetical protein [Gammaproteobacteria bacterium]
MIPPTRQIPGLRKVRHTIHDGSATGNVFYKIEYWQFFCYNGAHTTSNLGDHEGDWISVQLIVDPHNNRSPASFILLTASCSAST